MGICIEKVPAHQMEQLSWLTLKGVREFYRDPANVAAYEKWLIEYKRRKEHAKENET